jgi:hypothetical protein
MTAALNRIAWVGCVAALAAGGVYGATGSPTSDQAAVWQHHQETTSYFGDTSKYTCDGLEEKTRQVLLYFGVRADAKVEASCPDLIRPVAHAFVHLDFYTLAPASTATPASVPARWADVVFRPRHPQFMDVGECELVNQLKDVVSNNFSVRNWNYGTACTPHHTTIQDYRVSGQVLQPSAP